MFLLGQIVPLALLLRPACRLAEGADGALYACIGGADQPLAEDLPLQSAEIVFDETRCQMFLRLVRPA